MREDLIRQWLIGMERHERALGVDGCEPVEQGRAPFERGALELRHVELEQRRGAQIIRPA